MTDPYLDAWYDERGQENADKCVGEYGWPRRTGPADTDWANIRLGDRDYLIQKNWVNEGAGYCGLKMGDTADPLLPPR